MTSTEVLIRELKAPEHTALQERIHSLMNQLSRRGPQPALIAEALADPRSVQVGAFFGDTLVGIATYHYLVYLTDRVLYVNDVVVDESARRHGVARQLMEHIISEAQARRCTGVDLRSAQPGAIELYTQLGFIPLPTRFFRRAL